MSAMYHQNQYMTTDRHLQGKKGNDAQERMSNMAQSQRHRSNHGQGATQQPRGMTPEEYLAQRRALTPQRSRHSTPQRRAPPPGKFSQGQTSPSPRRHPTPQRQAASPRHATPQRYPTPQRRAPPPPPPPPSPRSTYQQNHYHQQPQSTQHYQEQRQGLSPYSAHYSQQWHGMQMQQKYQEPRQEAELREDQYNIQLMHEREAEISEINQKVTKVNEIYRDLAGLIDGQQELIDKVDVSLEEANVYTKSGIDNYNEARLRLENPIMEDFFGDKLGTDPNSRPITPGAERRRRVKNARSRSKKTSNEMKVEDFDCKTPFETIQDDLKDVVRDMKIFGSKIFKACTAPEVQTNEYATYR